MPPRFRRTFACLLLAVAPSLQARAPCASPSDEAWRETILVAVNRLRVSGAQCGARGRFAPAAPLRWASRLGDVARHHARFMASAGELTHLNAQGEGLVPRLRQSGYRFALVAENLANGWGSGDEAVTDWFASDSHCANLMDPRLREMGTACVVDGRQWPWWVMTLGTPRGGDI